MRPIRPIKPIKPTKEDYRGRSVLVVGLGLSGVAASRLLRSRGAVVTGADRRPREELSQEALALEADGVRLHLGSHPPTLLSGVDLVVASPGVRTDSPILQEARARGVIGLGRARARLSGSSRSRCRDHRHQGEVHHGVSPRSHAASGGAGHAARGEHRRTTGDGAFGKLRANGVRRRGLELSARDHRIVPSPGRGAPRRHSRSPGLASRLSGVRRRQGPHLRKPAGRRRGPGLRRKSIDGVHG